VSVVLVDAFSPVLEEPDEDDAQVLGEAGDVEGDAGVVELGVLLDHHNPAEVERDLVEGVDGQERDEEHLLVGHLVGQHQLEGLEDDAHRQRVHTLELVEDVPENHEQDLEFKRVD